MYGRMIRKRTRWRDDRGAAAVEFALVLPILILLLFGIIEFARAWNVRQTLTDAAREGARVAVVNNQIVPAGTLVTRVDSVVQAAARRAGLDLTRLQVTMDGISNGDVAAEVRLEYEYTPLLGLVLAGPITMRTASVMRNE
jgi:Flp pilus assembly protein TadG